MQFPSYDFELFNIPFFSPLQAQEFGATTRYTPNMPTGYADFSLNQLFGLMRPRNPTPYIQNQFPTLLDPYNPITFFNQKPDTITVYPSGTTPPELQGKGQVPEGQTKAGCNLFDLITGRCKASLGGGGAEGTGAIIGEGEMRSTDDAGIAKSSFGEKFGEFLKNLPTGSTTFLIAIVIIVLLLLFVRK